MRRRGRAISWGLSYSVPRAWTTKRGERRSGAAIASRHHHAVQIRFCLRLTRGDREHFGVDVEFSVVAAFPVVSQTASLVDELRAARSLLDVAALLDFPRRGLRIVSAFGRVTGHPTTTAAARKRRGCQRHSGQ